MTVKIMAVNITSLRRRDDGFRCSIWAAVVVFSSLLPGEVCLSDEGVAPTVQMLFEGMQKHFDAWQSASLQVHAYKEFKDPDTGEWKQNGVEHSKLAWRDDQRHKVRKVMYEPWNFPGDFTAFASEHVTVGRNLLAVTYEFRQPTSQEMAGLDMRWMQPDADDEITTDYVTWYEGPLADELLLRQSIGSIPLLTGKRSYPTAPEGYLLVADMFHPLDRCRLEACERLGYECWQITSTKDRLGVASVVICPDLNYAPVELKLSKTARDRQDIGDGLVSDWKDDSGNHMILFEHEWFFENVNKGWSEFTIRQRDWNEYSHHKFMGFGEQQHFSSVERPAPDDAFLLEAPLADGTPVFLQGTPQIKAEWRDGQVVRVYDGEVVKTLATVEMAPAANSPWRWLLPAGLLAVAVFLWRTRVRNQSSRQVPSGGLRK